MAREFKAALAYLLFVGTREKRCALVATTARAQELNPANSMAEFCKRLPRPAELTVVQSLSEGSDSGQRSLQSVESFEARFRHGYSSLLFLLQLSVVEKGRNVDVLKQGSELFKPVPGYLF